MKLTKKKFFIGLIMAVAIIMPWFQGVAINTVSANTDLPEYDKVGAITLSADKLPVYLRSSDSQAIMKSKMQAAYSDMYEKGFDMGVIAGDYVDGVYSDGVRQWPASIGIQEFRNSSTAGNHNADLYGRVHGYIMIGTVDPDIDCGALVNNMYRGWSANHQGSGTLKWGYPVGNPFELADQGQVYTYQNFINGYAYYNGTLTTTEIKNPSFVSGKFMRNDGKVTPKLTPKPYEVELGALSSRYPNWADNNYAQQITSAFQSAYQRIKATDVLRSGGYDLGSAGNYIEPWEPENVVMHQTFFGGDNSGKSYDNEARGYLMINDVEGQAYPLVGNNLTVWTKKGGFRNLGFPMSYPFAHGEHKIQVFSKSYMLIDEMDYPEVIYLYPGAISVGEDGSIEEGSIYAGNSIFEAYKQYNNDGGNFGVPVSSLKKLADGRYLQEFEGGDNGAGKGAIITSSQYSAAYPIKSEIYALINQLGIETTGGPLSGEIIKDNISYQNFSKGYINIKDKKFVPNKRISLISGTVKAIDEYDLNSELGVRSSFGLGAFDAEQLKSKYVAKAQEIISKGYYIGAPLGKVSPSNKGAIQEYRGLNKRDYGAMALTMSSPSAEVFQTKGQIHHEFKAKGLALTGFPISSEFVVNNRVYQNFEKGSITINGNRIAVFVENINVSSDGKFVNILTGEEANNVPDGVGEFGEIEKVPAMLRSYAEEVKEAFVAEYDRLQKTGINPGNPDTDFVHQWAPPGLSWVNQTFLHGESTANVFGMDNVVKIFLINLKDGCFSLYDEMFVAWANLGDIGTVGYPIGNQFYYNGDLYQNFYYGYIKCTDGVADTAIFYQGEKFEIPEDNSIKKPEKKIPWYVPVSIIGGVLVLSGAATGTVLVIRKKKGAK